MAAELVWPYRFHCYACRRSGVERRAVVRAFSNHVSWGGGEGWPACQEHQALAITEAMKPLAKHADWVVKAYVVEVDAHGYPKLGRMLFKARSKLTEQTA